MDLNKRAIKTHVTQMQRCTNPNNNKYSHYGAKGIRVEYTRKELYDWLTKNAGSRNLKNLIIGRIDHSKNYSLDNIEITNMSENSRESSKRTKGKMVACYFPNGDIEIFGSAKEAGEKIGCARGSVTAVAKKRAKTIHGVKVEYYGSPT